MCHLAQEELIWIKDLWAVRQRIWVRIYWKTQCAVNVFSHLLNRKLLGGLFYQAYAVCGPQIDTPQQNCKCGLAKICLWDLFSSGFPHSSVQFSNMRSVLTTVQCCQVQRSDHLNCWRVMPFGATDNLGSITGETCVSLEGNQEGRSRTLIFQDKGQYCALKGWRAGTKWFYWAKYQDILFICLFMYVHVCLYMHMVGT